MYPLIRCISCGDSLGHVYDLYIQLKLKLEKTEGLDPHNSFTDMSLDLNCMQILEELCIDAECCRMHLSTNLQISKYYC